MTSLVFLEVMTENGVQITGKVRGNEAYENQRVYKLYQGFLTRMVYLNHISCLGYTILIGNPCCAGVFNYSDVMCCLFIFTVTGISCLSLLAHAND